jgi:hypothetical protein
MEKVIRICEITDRVTTIAENVDTETAKEIIRELHKDDPFGTYLRIILD